jgi:hypothetical protein
VYADAEDLELIKEFAARRGVPEAQIIREGIHLPAMSNRIWDRSLDWPTSEGTGDTAASDEVTTAVARAAARRWSGTSPCTFLNTGAARSAACLP